VTDASGNPVSGIAVTFAVASGGGTATGTSRTTDASGVATVGSWTLGAALGANTLTATATGQGLAGNPATFNATAAPAITLDGFTPSVVSYVPRLDGQASVTGGMLAALEFQLGASPWYSATTASLPATSAAVRAEMPVLPIGSHVVHVRATTTASEIGSADVPYTLSVTDAITLMRQLRPSFSGSASDPLTRAHLADLLVNLYGQGANAALLAGAACFPDTGAHWASGPICMLKSLAGQKGFTVGRSDGTYGPDVQLTTAELVSMLAKFLELPADAAFGDPQMYIQALAQAGLLPPGITASQLASAASAATNKQVTAALLYQAWVTYEVGGKTLAQTYVDTTLPSW
jgi:hypothetical protein